MISAMFTTLSKYVVLFCDSQDMCRWIFLFVCYFMWAHKLGDEKLTLLCQWEGVFVLYVAACEGAERSIYAYNDANM